MQPPRLLEYGLRYFAIDVKEAVRWRIAPHDAGCLVTVEFVAPERDDERRGTEHEEWRERTERLETCLAGRPVPPATPDRELILSTDLPGDVGSVRAHLAQFLDGVFAATLTVRDGAEPDGFDVVVDGDVSAATVTFTLSHPMWPASTSARLLVNGRGQGTRLTVRHEGWSGTAFDAGIRARQRARFARFWHRVFLRFTLEYARSWQIPTLRAADLKERLARPDVFVLDANRLTLWESGHVPQAAFVGQEDLPVDRLPADRDAELVFYCRDTMCLTAYLSAAKARTLGYPNTFVMEGGRQAWAESGYPLVPETGTDHSGG